MANRLEHANIRVKDIDQTIQFLTTAFPDFKVRNDQGEGAQRWVHIGTDTSYLALSEDTREQIKQGPGMNHIGFAIDDSAALRERLEAAGYKQSYFPAESHPHHRRTYFFDGNQMEWEFVEYFSDNPSERNDYTY